MPSHTRSGSRRLQTIWIVSLLKLSVKERYCFHTKSVIVMQIIDKYYLVARQQFCRLSEGVMVLS